MSVTSANALTASLAQVSAAPLLRQDRIELGLLARRYAQVPGITGVTVYTLDNQVVANTEPAPRGQSFTEAVTADDSTIGYVKLHLDAAGFAPQATLAQRLLQALWLIAVVAATLALALARPAVPAWLVPWRAAREATVEVSLPAASDGHVAVCNLHNQLSMAADERAEVVSAALEDADAVAGLYGGQAAALPGRGLCIHFPHRPGSDGDRAFEVICATFVLAGVLQQRQRRGVFRFGAHVFQPDDAGAEPADSPHVADASLLAASATNGQLAISAELLVGCEHRDGLRLIQLTHPLREDMSTVADECHLVCGLNERYQTLIQGQVESLAGDTGAYSTDNASTF